MLWAPCAGTLQASAKQADTGIDSAGSASTVVLREVHCALLRIIQSQGVERDKKEASKGQPTTAKLFSPDSSGPVPWTAQVAQAILAAPAVGSAATAKVRVPGLCCALLVGRCILLPRPLPHPPPSPPASPHPILAWRR